MEEQLVSFETAKLSKEKGFSWNTVYGVDSFNNLRGKLASSTEGSYISWDRHDKDLRIPTQSLLQKWLRDEHMFHVMPTLTRKDNSYDLEWYCEITLYNYQELKGYGNWSKRFNTYEEALESGLLEALQLV